MLIESGQKLKKNLKLKKLTTEQLKMSIKPLNDILSEIDNMSLDGDLDLFNEEIPQPTKRRRKRKPKPNHEVKERLELSPSPSYHEDQPISPSPQPQPQPGEISVELKNNDDDDDNDSEDQPIINVEPYDWNVLFKDEDPKLVTEFFHKYKTFATQQKQKDDLRKQLDALNAKDPFSPPKQKKGGNPNGVQRKYTKRVQDYICEYMKDQGWLTKEQIGELLLQNDKHYKTWSGYVSWMVRQNWLECQITDNTRYYKYLSDPE